MRRALISDIHGNLEALEVVLDDIKAQGSTEIFCLGDIIGYGPNPRECIDRVMETCKITFWATMTRGRCSTPTVSTSAPSGRFSGRASSSRARTTGEQRAALGVPGRAAPDASPRIRSCSCTARPAIR